MHEENRRGVVLFESVYLGKYVNTKYLLMSNSSDRVIRRLFSGLESLSSAPSPKKAGLLDQSVGRSVSLSAVSIGSPSDGAR